MLIGLLRNNWFFFLPYAFLLVVVGVLQLVFTQEQLMQWINVRNNPLGDWVFPYVTYMGDGAFYVVVCVGLLIYNRRIGFMAFASFALSSLTSLFLKTVIFPGSLRPLRYFEHSTFEYHIIEGLDIYSYNSFPSGHTTTAFAMFLLLALMDSQKKRGLVFLFLAAITGYSRVYLFQHFVEDVYAGSLVGTISSLLIYVLMWPWVIKKENDGAI
ncbi:phosphatase PAP2 family protein [Spirosoma sp. BT702]|uniref:Phosphatase PAP2 family protein n=1 Tax=Spirosoma profusum TaxID=2771354 RepID=A0A926XVC0_9BACT|nr:phosphatase PAP2 family protein [Spirosoma profusum]MBD2701107.1 phosphatase PAP2 family protein [Spirosoma profusum]